MPDEPQTVSLQEQFAMATAVGQKVAVWAKTNGVPLRTCYDWRKTEEYKQTVAEVRRRALDGTIGQLVRGLTKATKQIMSLSLSAQSESVRLQAARAVVKEFMALHDYVDLEERVTELERESEEDKNGFSYPPPSNPYPVATPKSP